MSSRSSSPEPCSGMVLVFNQSESAKIISTLESSPVFRQLAKSSPKSSSLPEPPSNHVALRSPGSTKLPCPPHPFDPVKSLFMQGAIPGACSNVYLTELDPEISTVHLNTWIIRQLTHTAYPRTRFQAWLETITKNRTLSILDLLQEACVQLQVQDCQNKRCQDLWQQLDKVAPPCSWKGFRNWILVSLSCQSTIHEESCQSMILEENPEKWPGRIGVKGTYPAGEGTIISGPLNEVFNFCRSHPKMFWSRCNINLMEVCDLFYWALLFLRDSPYDDKTRKTIDARLADWKKPELPPQKLFLEGVQKSLKEASSLLICSNRLWNLVVTSERGSNVTPAVVDLIQSAARRGSYGFMGRAEHGMCSAEHCDLADNNNTHMPQPHKCGTPPCINKPVTFELGLLPNAIAEDRSTAWILDTSSSPYLSYLSNCSSNCTSHYWDDDPKYWAPKDLEELMYEKSSRGRAKTRNFIKVREKPHDYMAVSHVWSDGTGCGASLGKINPCLIEFFWKIAEDLDCDEIWWDAISIPTDPKTKRSALAKMHEIYRDAYCTLVHDEYLLNFDWADDGSPCLAMVLSPWFSRGWTALELRLSKSVKVLFRNPDCLARTSNPYVIKDLVDDILPTRIANLGHKYAAAIIERVMDKEKSSFKDIFGILNTRTTAWAQDRLIIAALLTPNLSVKPGAKGYQITLDIVSKATVLTPSFLLHGHSTIEDSGPSSWCPADLFHLRIPQHEETSHRDFKFVRNSGSDDQTIPSGDLPEILGCWKAWLLEEPESVIPYSFHPSVEWKVRIALASPENCLLLQRKNSDMIQDLELFLLVNNIVLSEDKGVLADHSFIDCQYVGAVRVKRRLEENKAIDVWTRLGKRKEMSESAQEVIQKYRHAAGDTCIPNWREIEGK